MAIFGVDKAEHEKLKRIYEISNNTVVNCQAFMRVMIHFNFLTMSIHGLTAKLPFIFEGSESDILPRLQEYDSDIQDGIQDCYDAIANYREEFAFFTYREGQLEEAIEDMTDSTIETALHSMVEAFDKYVDILDNFDREYQKQRRVILSANDIS